MLALFFALATVAGCGDGDGGVDLVDTDSGSEISLGVGERITLRLDSNPTTGHSWIVDETSLPDGIVLVSSTYTAGDSGAEAVGSGGTEVFVFETTAPIAGIVRLTYIRPFDDPPVPERVVEYIIRVDGAPWPPVSTTVPGTATAVAPTSTPSTPSTPSTTVDR